MSSESFQRERELFERAAELSPGERAAFLADECGSEGELRARVEALLAEEARDGLLIEPVVRAARAAVALDGDPPAPPARIGGHRILGELGRGGMGVVYLAMQEDPPREVALKVLRAGAPRKLAERFRAESQILARLRHPGIAQVYRAGEEDGHAWIAMELVEGPPLCEHARRLDRRSRLELLVQVADAVEHAHRKGIVHRDLKPENVRVTGDGRPKVLDFGVARVVAGLEELQRTGAGELIGTLAYMAPEQLAGDPDAVDARTDVHALGLLLYELASGRPAFEPRGRSPAEVQAELFTREIEPLGRRDPAARGELEAIAAKALERAPARRYPSARAFARDLERYLAGEPVEARAGTTFRRLVRRTLRQRAFLAGLTLAAAGSGLALASGRGASFLALAAGALMLAIGLARAERARQAAEREGARAQRMLAFLHEMLASSDPAQHGSDVRLLDVVERATRDLDERFAGEPAIEAALRRTLGVTYRGLGRYDEARRELARAAELAARARPADPEEHATTLGWLAIANREQGRYAEAEELWREVIELRSSALGPDHSKTFEAKGQLALACFARGERAAALELAREALAGLRGAPGSDAREVYIGCGNLASMLVQEGALEEAEPLLREGVDGLQRLGEHERPDALVAEHNLAALLGELGRFDEAERRARSCLDLHERLFDEGHRGTNVVRLTLAGLWIDLGRSAQARRLLLTAARALRRVLDPGHPARAAATVLLAELRLQRGLDAAALRAAQRVERAAPTPPKVRRRLERILSGLARRRSGSEPRASAELRGRRMGRGE